MLNIGELLLCHVDTTIRHIVDLPLLKEFIERINLLLETGGTNFTRLVHEGDGKELSFTSLRTLIVLNL